MLSIKNLVNDAELAKGRSLRELQDWDAQVQQLLWATKKNRRLARLPKGALKKYCEEIVPIRTFLEFVFSSSRISVCFPPEGADDGLLTLWIPSPVEIPLQVVSAYRDRNFAWRMEMLSTMGYAPGYAPVRKAKATLQSGATYQSDYVVISRGERIATAIKLIHAALKRKALKRYSHSPWLLVDADLSHFEQNDIDTVCSGVKVEDCQRSFQRIYLLHTSEPRLCHRLL